MHENRRSSTPVTGRTVRTLVRRCHYAGSLRFSYALMARTTGANICSTSPRPSPSSSLVFVPVFLYCQCRTTLSATRIATSLWSPHNRLNPQLLLGGCHMKGGSLVTIVGKRDRYATVSEPHPDRVVVITLLSGYVLHVPGKAAMEGRRPRGLPRPGIVLLGPHVARPTPHEPQSRPRLLLQALQG